jgi:hypothetical protein
MTIGPVLGSVIGHLIARASFESFIGSTDPHVHTHYSVGQIIGIVAGIYGLAFAPIIAPMFMTADPDKRKNLNYE